MSFRERLIFLSHFRKRFHDTGAITPSSRGLARAMVAGLGESQEPGRILEVGPGTGAFTWEIIPLLGPDDELHLCEINGDLLAFLREKIEQTPEFAGQSDRIAYHTCPVQELDADLRYHHIISGLPFNNFPAELVEEILDNYRKRLLPGGTLRFFEYYGIRPAKIPFVSKRERERLRKISAIVGSLCQRHSIRNSLICLNLPPAVAWCLRFDP
ncbi:MAG: methyltransferase domain-containing protein [bacterium]